MFPSYDTLSAIWYYLYNLKNVKNTHGGGLLLVKFLAEACKSNTPPWMFFLFFFLNCTNGTKLRKASHIETVN